MVSHHLSLICRTMRIESYDSLPNYVRERAYREGVDLGKAKVVSFIYDEEARRLGYRKHDLTRFYGCSPTGDAPGQYVQLRCGWGDICPSRPFSSQSELKFMMWVILRRFGFKIHVDYINGNILIDLSEICSEQVETFRRASEALITFPRLYSDMGFTTQRYERIYGNVHKTDFQWPRNAHVYVSHFMKLFN